MKILVTGAAGFIGSHTCEALLARGHQVVGFDAFDTFLYDAARKERNIAPSVAQPGFTLVRGDILDEPLLRQHLPGVDVIVHLAALAGVRPSIREPRLYTRVNIEGTQSVLAAARAAGIKRVVFASSSSVYGARDTVPFVESDPCATPASPYAATKRACELLCSTERDLYGAGFHLLRFFTVYGPRQRPEMAIHRFVADMAQGKTLTLFGDGSSGRDYTFIQDIVAGVVASCENILPGEYEILNLGGTEPVSLLELVHALGVAWGTPALTRHEPDQPGDVPRTCADITRARAQLGYEPRVPLAEGLRRFVTWFRSET